MTAFPNRYGPERRRVTRPFGGLRTVVALPLAERLFVFNRVAALGAPIRDGLRVGIAAVGLSSPGLGFSLPPQPNEHRR